ncbi:MAG: PTS sugar transporter subunit IIA [Treponema sp.]|jgi:mannose/fructose/sorbose-specific phosphotransferase system IIA component|nr:PTS sugar transporter subunit IIA [Treponema sp.]
MVDVIFISHGALAAGMLEAAEMLLGKQERTAVLDLQPGDTMESFAEKLEQAIDSFGDPKNVLVLSDLPSGTTSNAANLMVLKKGIRYISGCSLPMAVEVFSSRRDEEMDNLVQSAIASARDGMVDSKELLEKIKL